MKGLSDAAWAAVAIISILLVVLLAYLWARLDSIVFAIALIVPGALFVYSVNRSTK